MAASKPTPEEKLFAIIQGAKASHPRTRVQAISLQTLLAEFRARVGPVDLDRVNQVLLGAAALLLVLCLLQPIALRPQMGRLLAKARTQQAPFIMAPPLEGLRMTEEYVQAMLSGNPFRTAEPALRAPQPERPAEPATLGAQGLLSDLRLVGISWGEEPTAMIEQAGVGQTHFLKVGEVVGPFSIKEILPDRVILRYGAQEIELF
jgi:hypothetical protein